MVLGQEGTQGFHRKLMQKDASYWIRQLGLQSHAEGGAFREVYRSSLIIDPAALNGSFHAAKSASTSIYFLLQAHQCSVFHRIKSDEVWHFYAGDPLDIYEFNREGALITHRLGPSPEKNEMFQTVILAGNWFAAKVANGGAYTLAGCSVAPGFDFEDFVIADRNTLLAQYPSHADLIRALTPAH